MKHDAGLCTGDWLKSIDDRWYIGHYPDTWTLGLHKTGTAGGGVPQHRFGGLPTCNFQRGTFDEGWEQVTDQRMVETIARANQLCNAYGLDTISCGVTISWAMECFERARSTFYQMMGWDENGRSTRAKLGGGRTGIIRGHT